MLNLKINPGQIFCLVLLGILVNGCTPGHESESRKLADEMKRSLKNDLLRAWYPVSIDTVYGGFLSGFTWDWQPEGEQNKMLVTQARHLWTLSSAAMFFNDEYYLQTARHGFRFLADRMWDTSDGGFYMLCTREGDHAGFSGGANKNAYSNAFAIYALSTYYKCTEDTAALDLAKNTFRWLNNFCYDPVYKGYFNNPLWKESSPASGSSAMITSTSARTDWKDQNTSIHLLEAFTQLYTCWPDSLLKERLTEMLYLVRDTFTGDKAYLTQFMERDWVPVSFRDSSDDIRGRNFFLDHVSFGHDVEAAFLMMEASHTLGREDTEEKTWPAAKRMIDHALATGWDDTNGGFYYEGYYPDPEGVINVTDSAKVWWVQAEGLNALLHIYSLFPGEERYFEAFMKQWHYIDRWIIDHEHGGWYANGLDNKYGREHAPKANIWKVNYHDSRAMMNCIRMLKEEQVH
jgi:mannobiose 2-epimerase